MGILGPQTDVTNGQRFNMPTRAQWSPQGYGPQTTGVPQIGPTMPPYVGATGASGATTTGMEGVGGYGTAGNNSVVASIANSHPFSLKGSPLWWALGSLIIGLLLLNAINWRRVVDEGASEHAHVGAVSESADERAAA